MSNIITENTLNTMNTTESIPETFENIPETTLETFENVESIPEMTLETTPENMTTPEVIPETPETTPNLRSLHKEIKPVETDNLYDVKDIATAKGFNKVYLGNKNFNIDPSKKYIIRVISFKTKETRDKKNLSNNLVKKTLKDIKFTSKRNAINTFNYIKNELKKKNLRASVACLIAKDDYNVIIHSNFTKTPEEKKVLIHKAATFYLIDGRPLTDHYATIATAEVKQAERGTTRNVDNSVTDDQKKNIRSQLAV